MPYEVASPPADYTPEGTNNQESAATGYVAETPTDPNQVQRTTYPNTLADPESAMYNPTEIPREKPIPNWKLRAQRRLGSAWTEDSNPVNYTTPEGWEAAWKLGWAASLEKKKEVLKNIYGPAADVQEWDFGEDGKHEIGTTGDGKWAPLEGVYTHVKDVPALVGGILGSPSGEAAFTVKVLKPAIYAGIAEYTADKGLQKWYDPDRPDPANEALKVASETAAGGVFAEGVLLPLARRFFNVSGTPGREAAIDAAENQGLKPLLVGQGQDSQILQTQYRQLQMRFTQLRTNALKRFQSLREDGLLKWIADNEKAGSGLDQFSLPELEALSEKASKTIDDSVASLSTGRVPIGEVLPRLQSALDLFDKSSGQITNNAYDTAFKTAVKDDVELDSKIMFDVFDKVERGVPVQTKDTTSLAVTNVEPTADIPRGVTVVPTATPGEPERWLTPNAELQGLIDKAKKSREVLSNHNPDGDNISAVEQLNAMRRSFSQFAYDNMGNNQGRLAAMVLDGIDTMMANPLNAASKDYLDALGIAMNAHQVRRLATQVKAMSNLPNADISTAQQYITNLIKPGNGQLLQFMENMFKGTPTVMQDVKNVWIDSVLSNPGTINKTLDNLKSKDSKMFNFMLSPGDETVLRKFADEKVAYESSWMSRTQEMKSLAPNQRIDELFSGGQDVSTENIAEYIKYGPENAKQNLQTAFISYLERNSATSPVSELGRGSQGVVSNADALISTIEKNKDLIKIIFDNPKAYERLIDLESYALQIRKTQVGVPGVATGGGKSADAGSSIIQGEAASQISQLPDVIEKHGIVTGTGKAAGKLVSMFLSPRLTAAILNYNGELKASGRISESGLQAVANAVKIIPLLRRDDRLQYNVNDVHTDTMQGNKAFP